MSFYHGIMLIDFLFKIYKDMKILLVNLNLMKMQLIKQQMLWINGLFLVVKV